MIREIKNYIRCCSVMVGLALVTGTSFAAETRSPVLSYDTTATVTIQRDLKPNSVSFASLGEVVVRVGSTHLAISYNPLDMLGYKQSEAGIALLDTLASNSAVSVKITHYF